jgi:sarcosine oxidase, subunit gamma
MIPRTSASNEVVMPPIAEYRAPLEGVSAGAEAARPQDLVLRDLSTLPKLGIKGPGAATWLQSQGIQVPPETYDARPLADGGLIVRLGLSDFFLEGGASGSILIPLSAEVSRFPPQVYRVERQDATILLSGARALEVLAQLCSIDFRSAPVGRVYLTRAGGVNCAVLPESSDEGTRFRIWVDYTFAVSFWESLAEIRG